ncbi:MAG: aminotransferase class IV [Saprospiraceae bacterium]|nr:aminotransferase class IV [Saprospiraceae bacterium]
MSLLVESIKIFNGRLYNMDFHETRFNETRKKLFGITTPLSLRRHMVIPSEVKQGLVKCRVTYNNDIHNITFQPYKPNVIHSVKLVVHDDISYAYKFEQRAELDLLFDLRADSEEIMIIKNGLVTDAYYYNYLFEKDGHIFTPSSPLLCGTMRAFLLSKNTIIAKDIYADKVHKYDFIYMINAMTPLGKIKLKPNQIL